MVKNDTQLHYSKSNPKKEVGGGIAKKGQPKPPHTASADGVTGTVRSRCVFADVVLEHPPVVWTCSLIFTDR